MKIKRLYIGDFGIFKNQTMDDISSGLIVIGGYNRAGKSTFLEILKHLGYGIPKGSKIPSPTVEYMVEADVINDYEEKYNIRLQGYRDPMLTVINSNSEISIKELYGNIDAYTYSELFTITLDELQKVNLKQGEQLQTVLMGAGFKEIAQIPSMVSDFKKEAEKIGGKNGSVSIKQFKPYNQKIVDCIKIKQEEKRKIDLYFENIKALEKAENRILLLSQRFEYYQNKVFLLDIVKSSIEKYRDKVEIEAEIDGFKTFDKPEFESINHLHSLEGLESIRTKYSKVFENYKEAEYYFKSNISNDPNTIFELKKIKERAFSFEGRLLEIKEKLVKYNSAKEFYENEKADVVKETSLTNEGFKGNLNNVLNISCDDLSQDRLLKLSVDHNSLNLEIKQLDKEIEDLSLKEGILQRQRSEISSDKEAGYIRKYFYIALLIALTGVIFSIFNRTVGLSISLLGIACTTIYSVVRYNGKSNRHAKYIELSMSLKEIEMILQNKKNKLTNLDSEMDDIRAEIAFYQERLQLHESISLEGLRDYLKKVQDLKRKIILLTQKSKSISLLKEEIENELSIAADIVIDLQHIKGMKFLETMLNRDRTCENDSLYKDIKYDNINFIENWRWFIGDIEKIIESLRFLERYDLILNEKLELEELIKRVTNYNNTDEELLEKFEAFICDYKMYLEYKNKENRLTLLTRELLQNFSTERAKNALKSYFNITEDSNCNTNDIFNIYSELNSSDTLSRDYKESQKEMEDMRLNLDREKDGRQHIRDEIKRLSTVEKLENAQRQIDKSRAEMKILAERYAVENAAAFILEQVQKAFIEGTKGTLLRGASEMFKDITSGEYVNISPSEDFFSYDYAVTLEDESIQPTMDILSRGTSEQVFLSVRLSRIKEIRPSLPIILDDPFVNFDNPHVEKVLEVIGDISKTNQVFILTCHPQLIRQIDKQNLKAQYFKLNKGKISSTDSKTLIEYLSNK